MVFNCGGLFLETIVEKNNQMDQSSKSTIRRERERMMQSEKKRNAKNNRLSNSLGKSFTVISIQDLNQTSLKNTDEWIVDGLGGFWKAESYERKSLLQSVKLRSPKKLGSLNLLQLYEGDLISVIGACDQTGNDKASVKRKTVTITIESEESKHKHKIRKHKERLMFLKGQRNDDGSYRGDRNSKHRNKPIRERVKEYKKEMTTTTKEEPVHDPSDTNRMWFGTIVRSGRGSIDEEWPSWDRRQRIGRFPQSAVVLYDSKTTYTDIDGSGTLKLDDSNADQFRCEVCSKLTKEARTAADAILEMTGLLQSRKQPTAVFTDVCSCCLKKLVNVCQTVAKTMLLKPNPVTSMKTISSNCFNIDTSHIKKSSKRQSPGPLYSIPPTSPTLPNPHSSPRRHNYVSKVKKVGFSKTSTDDKGHMMIETEIKHGPLGIEFNKIGEILAIKRNTQAYDIPNLSKGDRLIQIDNINVEGMTTSEMMTVLQSRTRPLNLKFEKHYEWITAVQNNSNSDNGLPDVDMDHISILFDKHDQDNSLALTANEFAAFMADIHEISSMKRGRDFESGYYPLELATRLIDAYDTNNDGGLDLEELLEWITNGLSMSSDDRNEFKKRGGYCESSARFVEEIATACPFILENCPEYLTEENLWDELDGKN